MPITKKGVTREVNKQLQSYRLSSLPTQVELTSYDMYRAEYAAELVNARLQDPVLRGIKTGLGIFKFMSDYAAVYPHATPKAMYRLSTQDSHKKIDAYTKTLPESLPRSTRSIRFASKATVSILANHGLWLASNDVSKMRDIPDALEERLSASSKDPARHLHIAVSAAVGVAANIAASVNTFEQQNGINNRGTNVAGFAIYGYSADDFTRVSSVTDVVQIGRF